MATWLEVLADQQRCLGGEEHRRFVELLRQTADG